MAYIHKARYNPIGTVCAHNAISDCIDTTKLDRLFNEYYQAAENNIKYSNTKCAWHINILDKIVQRMIELKYKYAYDRQYNIEALKKLINKQIYHANHPKQKQSRGY